MAAVTETITCASIYTAENTLVNRGFSRTSGTRRIPSQWMNGAHHWATVEKMPSGKFLVRIGVSTL